MSERGWLVLVLVLMGAGWGVTMPLTKIAVSEGYRQFGLIFWQLVISALILGALLAVLRRGLPMGRVPLAFYAMIALVGTVIPNSASYQAAIYLPAGVISILLSMVPMFAFPIALLMGNERFAPVRLAGLVFGLIGVSILVLPEASLPERAMIVFIPLALVSPVLYGLEGNLVARLGTGGTDPIQLLCEASMVGAVIALPLAIGSGQWIDPRGPWGAPDWALVLSSLAHALVYSTYVWMVGRAGVVFAAQVSYLVTGFGVVWAMLLLGERYSGWIWAAMAVMLVGLFLIQPRRRDEIG